MKYQSSNTKTIYDVEFDTSRKKRYKCPECSNNRSKQNVKDLEYYPSNGRAYCFHCNTTMFEYKPHESVKQYVVPEWKNKTELTDKAVKYFESRMITQNTLIKCKVHSDTEWMPQFQKEMEVICFPFFRNGKLINTKFRGAKKSFKLVSGAELIWWNFDAIAENTEIIICEGEIDGLTFVENGFDNVLSVPNGANNNLEYLDNSIELFEHVTKIYLATDTDTKGIELKDELIRRFGAERCLTINFKECKDANEYFIQYGGYDFKTLLNDAKDIPIKGNIEIKSLYSDILDLYENGLQEGSKIEFEDIDKYCTWELGRLAIVTGIPSSGKSEFVDYLITRLNLLHGWKAAYFTPENYPLKYHYSKLHEKFSGSKFEKATDTTDFQSIYEYIKDNFFYIMDESDLTVESIMQSAKSYIKQKGIKMLVIDPYNKLDHQQNRGENETQYISRFLDVITNFARFNNVLIFLVAHPRKMDKDTVPTLYDISGSANFYNKTDYGLTVHRNRDDNGLMGNSVDIHWQKIKFKHLGTQGVSQLEYNYKNGRFFTGSNYNSDDWIASGIKENESGFFDNLKPSNDEQF